MVFYAGGAMFAEPAGMSSRLLVLLLLIFMLVVGILVISMAFRRPSADAPAPGDDQRACAGCRHRNEPAARFCANCGQPLD